MGYTYIIVITKQNKSVHVSSHSNNYLVLARKYRPTNFNQIIGQEALTVTLQHAFNLNKIAHAFMFTGEKGTGKTSTARIIAKSLNCTGNDGSGGITLNPCGECNNCISITKGSSLDVIEMDAASHTGVDDIRQIIENVKYSPHNSRFSIYIIDEVHMLSKSAFNALLKTLEEPPKHVKFIFATTEIKKVPVTILSRCQHFHLKRVSEEQLTKHFANLCKLENIKHDEQSLPLIAKVSNGSVRDGLSILDRAIVYCSADLTKDKIFAMLGKSDSLEIYHIIENIIEQNDNQVFELFIECKQKGIEVTTIFENMLEALHALNIIKVFNKAYEYMVLSDEETEILNKLSKKLNISTINILWQMILKGLEELKESPMPLEHADMLLTRILWSAKLPTIQAAIKTNNNHSLSPSPSVTQQQEVEKPTLSISNSTATDENIENTIIDANNLEISNNSSHGKIKHPQDSDITNYIVSKFSGSSIAKITDKEE